MGLKCMARFHHEIPLGGGIGCFKSEGGKCCLFKNPVD
jgi:hypothetical protein